jgi:hypothetical protein
VVCEMTPEQLQSMALMRMVGALKKKQKTRA